MEQIILDTRKMNYSSIMHDYVNNKDYEIIGDKEELMGILNTNLCESNIEERVKEYYKKALDDFIYTNARDSIDSIDRIVEYIANMSKYGLEILNELKLIDYCESVPDPYGNCEPEPGRLIIDRKALIAYRDRKYKEWNDMFKDSIDAAKQDYEE